MSLFRNVILPLLGVGVEYHLHHLNSELAKHHHTEAEDNAKKLSITDLITTTLSTKLESYRDSCEEKLKKYSNYLLITGILIGVLGQLLPSTLPTHQKYILGSRVPLITVYYFFLTNTVGCLISCFITCIVILNNISYYMINVNQLWSSIETQCITALHSSDVNKLDVIQDLLSTQYYTVYHHIHIHDLESWFDSSCYTLHCIIIVSAISGIVSFITSFVLSLAAVLIPIRLMGESRSITAFWIVIVLISVEMFSLFLYITYRIYTKKSLEWYSSKTGHRVVFTNSITVRVL
jgi:hypothetical protein